MSTLPSSVVERLQRQPLAACIAVVLVLAAPAAIASATVSVGNCNDTGSGSLRAVIGAATTLSGFTVDMTQMGCSSISLLTGAITISQSDLTLVGPASGVTITGKNGIADRIFNHTGFGLLGLEHLDIAYGSAYSTTAAVSGGCIESNGSVFLYYSSVNKCSANARNTYSYGGGVATHGSLSMTRSTISDNSVGTLPGAKVGKGGGVLVNGDLLVAYSSISGNVASGEGGGIAAGANVAILNSTISANTAGNSGGLAMFSYQPATNRGTIVNSTISGNTATNIVGGVYSSIPITLQNSTIAFNTAAHGSVESTIFAAGLALSSFEGSFAANLQSSLLSNNTHGTDENDFSVYNRPGNTVTVTGANNLIGKATGPLPPLTTYNHCPLLGPLRDNGGPTSTHALLSHSPAIDQGNNTAGYSNDQRGATFTRVDHALTDIGAYEVQQGDIVFNTGFDGCPF